MARIYLTGSGPTKGYATGSGIISNPVRILLQERDNKTGSYPTIARTGDPDFTGAYSSLYDDTNTVNFVGSSQTVYPTGLRSTSKWVSGGVATPNILQGLTTVGTASKGVADAHISFTPGENLSAFNESRVYIDNDAEFYQTGTNDEVLPGFDQRLGSKTIISLDINPTVATNVFFSTGSVVSGKSVNSGMVYFNWYSKKWEIVGNLTTGSNIDIFNSNPAVRSNAIHPAGGLPDFVMSSPLSNTARHVGIFHSTHGFPFATQYNSTGSQELSLTGTLSAPFLLEKVVLEWSGSFASYPSETLGDGPLCYQFFLMNVSPVSDSVTIVQDLTGSVSGEPTTFTTRNSEFSVTQVKDVVWAGTVARYYSALTASVPSNTYERDLNLVKMSADSQGISAVTGSYRIQAAAGIYGKNDGLQSHALRGSTLSPLLANKIGFRNFGGYVEGKSFIRPISAINPSGSFYVTGSSSTNKYKVSFMPSEDVRRDSPYLLLPNHKLVLGFYGVPIQGTGGPGTGPWTEVSASEHVTTLSPGAGKLTLYGSFLRNGQPVGPETNQPLTSDSVHEDLHFNNSVFDQFDVEPLETFKNSYVDLIVTGSMLAAPIGNSTAANVRKVQASVTAGQAGTTGSLQRFVNLASESDVFYDSYPPNPVDIISEKVGGGFVDYVSEYRLVVASPTSQYAGFTGIDAGWYMRTAYEVSSNRFTSVNYDVISRPAYDLTGLQTSQAANLTFPKSLTILSSESDLVPIIPGMDSALIYVISDDSGNRNSEQAGRMSLKAVFGFGNSKYNIPTLNFVSKNVPGTVVTSSVEIRGYKYGLTGLAGTYANNRFRRDRYGQFRDMLEQSPNAAYFVNNSVEYPLEVKFFSRPSRDGKGRAVTEPEKTHTQNLNAYATSSLPYFDGDAREREDNPDITLVDIYVG